MSHTTSINTVPMKSASALREAVARLQRMGINCELLENAVPRMYYRDQIEQHVKAQQDLGNTSDGYQFHANPEECDYVLRLPDSFYDIGFLRNAEGSLVPFFDDYERSAPHLRGSPDEGKVRISKLLSAVGMNVKSQHWSGQRNSSDTAELAVSVGKLLQQYTAAASIEAATAQGYCVEGETVDEAGNIHLTVSVA